VVLRKCVHTQPIVRSRLRHVKRLERPTEHAYHLTNDSLLIFHAFHGRFRLLALHGELRQERRLRGFKLHLRAFIPAFVRIVSSVTVPRSRTHTRGVTHRIVVPSSLASRSRRAHAPLSWARTPTPPAPPPGTSRTRARASPPQPAPPAHAHAPPSSPLVASSSPRRVASWRSRRRRRANALLRLVCRSEVRQLSDIRYV